jgi:hypothetical protein
MNENGRGRNCGVEGKSGKEYEWEGNKEVNDSGRGSQGKE